MSRALSFHHPLGAANTHCIHQGRQNSQHMKAGKQLPVSWPLDYVLCLG